MPGRAPWWRRRRPRRWCRRPRSGRRGAASAAAPRTARSATPIRAMRASPMRRPSSDDHGGDADEREVAVTAGDLLERPARAGGSGWHADLGEQLVVVERRGEVPDEELVGRHDPLAAHGSQHQLRARWRRRPRAARPRRRRGRCCRRWCRGCGSTRDRSAAALRRAPADVRPRASNARRRVRG